jgi:hypothetical protein
MAHLQLIGREKRLLGFQSDSAVKWHVINGDAIEEWSAVA